MAPKYVDIHTHVHFDAYDEDRAEVIKRAHDAGVWMVNVGTTLADSKTAVQLAEQYDEGVYATVGLHPTHTDPSAGRDVEEFDAAAYRELLAHPKVVALGECGLDYFRLDESSKRVQQDVFDRHVELAAEAGKPLMLHIREAYEDAHAILKGHAGARGNVHFFAGNWEQARLFLDLGFTISFTGVLTFTSDYDEVVRSAPIESLMSETDAPYVAPVPHRGRRNEPVYVIETVKRIAAIRGEEEGAVARALAGNARRAFRL